MKKIITIFILLNTYLLSANTHIAPNLDRERFLNTVSDAAKRGDYRAQYDLATIYRDGTIAKIDFKRAFYFYHKSALKNFAPSQYQLGMAFRHGVGVKQNHERARYWLRKATKNRYRQAEIIFNLYYAQKRVIKQYRFTNYQK
jgi:TPR repeat protein